MAPFKIAVLFYFARRHSLEKYHIRAETYVELHIPDEHSHYPPHCLQFKLSLPPETLYT